jgi:hypothetical protein
MFTIDQKITDLNVKEMNVLKILFSMNIHQVATPEMILEEARSYILFFRERKARISVYIAIHLLSTDRKLYYSHSSNPFPEDELSAVEEEALGFAEGLGAMLDEKDFTKLSDAEQDRWIDDQDIFSKKPLAEPRPAIQSAAPPAQPEPTAAQPMPQAPPIPPAPQAPIMQNIPDPQPAPAAQPVVHAAVVVPAAPAPRQQAQKPQVPPAVTPAKADKTAVSSSHSKLAPLAAAAKQQEIMQEAIKAGIAKAPKQALNKQAQPATGIVSRDCEALARLLTSF